MKKWQALSMAVILLLVMTFSGCGLSEITDEVFGLLDNSDGKPLPMPPNSALAPEPLAEKFDVDVYWDTTISMQGFTKLAAGNVYRQLPDTLGDIGNSFKGKVQFFRFGEKITSIEGRDYLQFRNSEAYTELITSFGNVLDEANPEHLSVVVTDLFESDADWSNVTQKCRDKYFSKHLSIAIIGIKNSFNGEIFDVGLNAASFSYDSGDDTVSFRPFYLFLMGSESQVRAFMEKWVGLTTLPANEMQYVVFSEHFSPQMENLRVVNATPGEDKKNLLEDRRLPKTDDRLQEVVISNRGEEVSLNVPGKFQPYPDVCLNLSSSFETRVKIFAWNGEWQEQEGKDANVLSSVEKISDENGNNLKLNMSFNPQNTLPTGRICLLQVQIIPAKNGLSVPNWISIWDMANVDIEPEQFDGSKTVNLKRIATSLKDSLLTTIQPTIMELDLVIDER